MGETDYEVNLDAWRLKVTGHVKTPLSLTYSQMLSLPSIERSVLLICPGFLANKVFLAYDVNAKALSKKHGFPLRVVAEGYYGTNWVKYVYKVKV